MDAYTVKFLMIVVPIFVVLIPSAGALMMKMKKKEQERWFKYFNEQENGVPQRKNR